MNSHPSNLIQVRLTSRACVVLGWDDRSGDWRALSDGVKVLLRASSSRFVGRHPRIVEVFDLAPWDARELLEVLESSVGCLEYGDHTAADKRSVIRLRDNVAAALERAGGAS